MAVPSSRGTRSSPADRVASAATVPHHSPSPQPKVRSVATPNLKAAHVPAPSVVPRRVFGAVADATTEAAHVDHEECVRAECERAFPRAHVRLVTVA